MSLAQKIAPWIGAGKIGTEVGAGAAPVPGLAPTPLYLDCHKAWDGVPNRADFYGHAERLPFHDHALDYVVAGHVLEHAGDPAAALAEWYRVVRPGGFVCMIVATVSFPPESLRALLTVQPEPQPRLLWEIAEFTEDGRDLLAILRVRKGWLARAQSEVFHLRAAGHPRAALRDDAQSFAEWAANTPGSGGPR